MKIMQGHGGDGILAVGGGSSINCGKVRSVRSADPEALETYAGLDRIEEMNTRLEIPRLSQCCRVDRARFEESLEKMAGDALASGSPNNNPVVPTAGQIRQIYRDSW